MYMLFHLTPSVEVTGGVWYTDNEFDSAFVRVLLDHIYNYIAKKVYHYTFDGSLSKLTNLPPIVPPSTHSKMRTTALSAFRSESIPGLDTNNGMGQEEWN